MRVIEEFPTQVRVELPRPLLLSLSLYQQASGIKQYVDMLGLYSCSFDFMLLERDLGVWKKGTGLRNTYAAVRTTLRNM